MPPFIVTPEILQAVIQIESIAQKITHLPITPIMIAKLRESARLQSVHYSTQIEGNRLSEEEIKRVVDYGEHIPSRERDEQEVKGYFAALDYLETTVRERVSVSERVIRMMHALVMAGGNKKIKPTSYRDGQNVIREGISGRIVYLPPEAKDVPTLMADLVQWINESTDLPAPIVAGIAHYQFATIHPYYDGNGRTSRLLATLILHLRGYDLKGIYSLDEYYARDLKGYYEALTVGPSHNYYAGRAEADITKWVQYFVLGMLSSFTSVLKQAQQSAEIGFQDQSDLMRKLDPEQRYVLSLFKDYEIVTSSQIADFLKYKPRTIRNICSKWVDSGFLKVVEPSRKARKYALSKQYESLLMQLNKRFI